MTRSSRWGAILYWTGAVVLTVFGFLDLVGIGAPFFLTGLVMVIVGAWRHRPEILWPPLFGVWAFVVGYVLVAPLECTASATPAPAGAAGSHAAIQIGRTVCTSVLGIDYSGAGNYNAPLMPAFLAGLAAGLVAAALVRRLLGRSRHAPA